MKNEKWLSPAGLASKQVGEKVYALEKKFEGDPMQPEISVQLFQIILGRTALYHGEKDSCGVCGIIVENGNTVQDLSTKEFWFFMCLDDAQNHAIAELVGISKKWADAADKLGLSV